MHSPPVALGVQKASKGQGIGAACAIVFWDRARKRARNPPKCEVWRFPYGNRRKLTWRCKGRSSASAGRYVPRRISGAAPFCAFLRTSAQNMTRGALTVRRCDCAKMHMIPIAYQLPESRPIAYQDVTHVNIMRSAPARRARSPARPPRRCPISQPATLHQSVSPQSARETV